MASFMLPDNDRSMSAGQFQDQGRLTALSKSLYQSWKSGKYCDITLSVGDSCIKAHKVVLLSLSGYFKPLLEMDVDGKQDVVELHMDYKRLCDILEFGYTGQISISGDNVQDLLIAADYLQVDFLKTSCEEYMVQNMDACNCVSLFILAGNYSLKRLRDEALRKIAHDFQNVSKTPEFFALPSDLVLNIIADENVMLFDHGLPVPQQILEVLLLQGVVRYIRESAEGMTNAVKLLEAVQLNLINYSRIIQELKSCPGLENDEVRKLLDNVRSVQRGSGKVHLRQKIWFNPRKLNGMRIISNARSYANGGQVAPTIGSFDDQQNVNPNSRILEISVVVRLWDGRRVVGGMVIKYSDGTYKQYGLPSNSTKCVKSYNFSLQETEAITKITLRSGWMIDCLTFITNFGNNFGPYGGDGGSEHIAEPPSQTIGYLHTFSGRVVKSQGCEGITYLTFDWMCIPDTIPDLCVTEHKLPTREKRKAKSVMKTFLRRK